MLIFYFNLFADPSVFTCASYGPRVTRILTDCEASVCPIVFFESVSSAVMYTSGGCCAE